MAKNKPKNTPECIFDEWVSQGNRIDVPYRVTGNPMTDRRDDAFVHRDSPFSRVKSRDSCDEVLFGSLFIRLMD